MGRYRITADAKLRLKKKGASSNEKYVETMASGAIERGEALYHCNYCNMDITGRIRIKCTICTDFDLCVSCFSVGAEVTPHKSNHPYRVMECLYFPLICPEWSADEEILLLEGIEMYGPCKWTEIAEHVGTKNRVQCISHYSMAYMNSPCYPLPDMSHISGKNREELLAMGNAQDECKEDPQTNRIIDAAKLTHLVEASGFNPKRQEFNPEYDNEAEALLVDMEFKETDNETERELKLRMIHIYSSRLDERKRRKEFILQRNLLYPQSLEKEVSDEDKEIYERYKVFMRFQSQEDHNALVQSVIEERNIRRRIQELVECRAAGCRSMAEAKMYIERKRKRESEAVAQEVRESSQIVASKLLPEAEGFMKKPLAEHDGSKLSTVYNHEMNGRAGLETSENNPSVKNNEQDATRSFERHITRLPASELLSQAELQLCSQNRLLPTEYLKVQEVLAREILKGNIVKKSDSYRLFRLDPNKVDKVYDIVMKKLGPIVS